MNEGHSGIVSFSPQMKMTQLPAVRMTELSSASFQWNSSPASAATTTRMGSAMTMPMCGSVQPKMATVAVIMPSGFQAQAPILLIHGADDTVVPIEQSKTMERALKSAGKPVQMVTLKGEDHWLSRDETRTAMLKASVDFVKRYNPPN